MIRHQPFILALLIALAPAFRPALADAYDPPASYYPNSLITSPTLKSDLNDIIDGQTSLVYTDSSAPYRDLRTELQITDDATPDNPNDHLVRMLYHNGEALDVAGFAGPPPGWDPGVTWNREHSWPQARGVDSTGQPDGTDLHHMFPTYEGDNSDRANLNFGGAYGGPANPKLAGIVTDGGTKYYPGDADAGRIARAEFYMAVRYDGADSGTQNLELAAGDPASGGTTLGDLNRLMEWHFQVAPDTFERRRNQLIYANYQNNRNPFIDHPEYTWSIFMNQTNDSQLTLAAPTTINTTTGASTRTINLPNVIVGGSASQAVTLNKSGNNGTYYSVTTSSLATSTVTGPFNAFRIITSGTDSKSFNVGLNTATSGLRTETVTIDNLDITPGSNGGVGHAANDGNDVITVNGNVLDHATPLFASNQATSLTLDFGNIALGDGTPSLGFGVLNKVGTASFTAALDLDSFTPAGHSAAFTTSLAPFTMLAAGSSQAFTSSFVATGVGTFTANYTLNLSDENLSGATNKTLALTLTGKTRLAGDYNGDLVVDANDYVVWRDTMGQSSPAFGGADGDGSGLVTDDDYSVWRAHFGQTATAGGSSFAAAIPEPTSAWIALIAGATLISVTGRNQVLCHSLIPRCSQ